MLTKNNLTEAELMQGKQVVKVIRGSRVNSYQVPRKIVPAIYAWKKVEISGGKS